MNLLASANTAGLDVLAVIDPGEGTAPPGSEGLVTIVNWVAWVAVGLCVVGVICAGVGMLFAGRRGEGGEQAVKLGWVMAGSIVIGGAAGLVGALV
ncbi:hypothetical protein GCU67_20290 [Modestobacter muralis]|uniref:Conjugal transfer protein TrbC n=1 Tax=Modestobacter muralis TaxID=1608614 RepID=A0A6P0F0R4_9ACTN|nr:hypothetical protein [Modestobacter muralis]NEK96489.1 hypothetical protein [Modestobacter muralis]NEN53389.1 hypothetical protein [Modestobacter muralis]